MHGTAARPDHPTAKPTSATGWMPALSCGHCGFSIRPRAGFLRVEHCPRCLAKRRVAVRLREDDESEPRPTVDEAARAPREARGTA